MLANDHTISIPAATVYAACAAAAGWLLRATVLFLKDHAVLEKRVKDIEDNHKSFKGETTDLLQKVADKFEAAATRLTKSEEAIMELRSHVQRTDEQFLIILNRLESLPRVEATLEAWKPAIEAIVPRPEVDRRTESLETQMRDLQTQVRDMQKGS